MFVLLLGFLALGPQVVLSNLFTLSISPFKQCDRFSINFNGKVNKTSSPSSLSVLPFDSVPISIPVPSNALSFSSLDINFLSLKENTTFVVSLDNADDEGLSLVSDVIQISGSQNATCLPPVPANSTPSPYAIVGGVVRQCEDFTVEYNTTDAPKIRIFSPNGFSFPLTMTSNSNGRATYTMMAGHGQEVVLLFDDGKDSRRTSSLLPVDGDSSSSEKCLSFFGNFTGQPEQSDEDTTPNLSKGVIIGLGIGGAIIVLVALAMTVFVVRERNRTRRPMTTSPIYNLPPQPSRGRVMIEKPKTSPPLPPLPTSATITYPEGYIKDPPYVSEKYSPTISDYPRTSISWEMVDGETQPKHRISRSTQLSTMDIEKMLDIATERDSRLPASPTTPPAQYTYVQPVDLSPRYRSRPDVPENPSFFGSSSYAEMHGFGEEGDSIRFFGSPRTVSDLRSTSSFDARISHGSDSPGFALQRLQNPYLPRSPTSSGYPSGVLEDRVRSSDPFR